MDITGKITGIKYDILLSEELGEIDINEFNINKAPSAFLLKDDKNLFAVSTWVSPKRTRSYPFERVYNTLKLSKKITVIPIVKDEGKNGDRDYIQWDTVSLMSLLDVFVIVAFYDKAIAHSTDNKKITEQQFNNDYIISKIKEIEKYHSSALHWNLNELNENLPDVIDKVKTSYEKIEKETGVQLHSIKGLDDFKIRIGKDVSHFMEFSREKSENAQRRESVTVQPKESLSTDSKAKITIENYLGGKYYFTVDETFLSGQKLDLIERKHSATALLPSKSDIKDGLLKMILYSNLSDVTVNGKKIKSEAVLCLTSPHICGEMTSSSSDKDIEVFLQENEFSLSQKQLIKTVTKEANQNKFIIQIKFSK
ncbi:hypothetical protein Barb7_00109 [Bacteroidales bacterium Barb7]|nr:hypothetical protein Barb7_00109 [Bacteroidales bacterium Barb7]